MTRPHTYLVRMSLFLGVVGVVCATLFLPMRSFFLANTALNGLIVGVLRPCMMLRQALRRAKFECQV